MARPMITGDTAGIFTTPPPASIPFTATATTGSTKVRVRNSAVMLDGKNAGTSTQGPGLFSGNVGTSAKVRIEGLPVLLNGGTVSAFGPFPGPATIAAVGATNISMS